MVKAQITLNWMASTDSVAVTYRVYRIQSTRGGNKGSTLIGTSPKAIR